MAIDPNILLKGIVPDVVGAAKRGFDFGREIKEAPVRARLLDQKIEAGERTARADALKQGMEDAGVISSVIGDLDASGLANPEIYNNKIAALKRIGVEIQPQNDPFSGDFTGFDSAASRLFEVGTAAKQIKAFGGRKIKNTQEMGGGVTLVTYDSGEQEVLTLNEEQQAAVDRGRKAEIDYEGDKTAARAGGTVRGRELTREELSDLISRTEEKIAFFTEAGKLDARDLSNLKATQTGRDIAIVKAEKFLEAFKKGISSGVGRQAANFLPIGTWTNQGEFDELLDAFAETAAREKLKASGETRPTDADVRGMKSAIFGIGRDEDVNIQLLQEFIDEQKALTKRVEEFDKKMNKKPSGKSSKKGGDTFTTSSGIKIKVK